ncbi:MAG: hypothetical protein F2799_08245 [Actinobacteria bacterium]|nr:hypothetical protein [Actinomycetota bacterium]
MAPGRTGTHSARQPAGRASNSSRPHRQLDLNSIGSVRFKLAEAIALDLFSINRLTGAAILIDPSTNETVGSVLITSIV